MPNKLLLSFLLLVLGTHIALAEEISVVDADTVWNLTLDDATDVGRLVGEPTLMVVKYADAFSYKSLEDATSVGRLVGEPDVMVVKYADAINYKPLENANDVDRLVGEPSVIVVKYADDRSWESELIKFNTEMIYGISLSASWNLISLPLMPEDTSITSVLSPINGNYSIVWEYNANDTADHWKKYDPGVPFGNDLTNIEPDKGYWIMMTSDDTLPISGTVPESTDIDLTTGWNLVGFNSLDSKPIAEALSSINGNYSIVWAYNANDTTDHWKKYDPGVPFGNDLINMEPGRGYWIM
ncbi:MAG: hypothetical protein GQ469_09470, partial [Methanosarcinales archaeon]|nr:hypothetical protein [Methanosarcinales archaeon]